MANTAQAPAPADLARWRRLATEILDDPAATQREHALALAVGVLVRENRASVGAALGACPCA